MTNRNFFKLDFKQTGRCCQIASCAFAFEYYCRLNNLEVDNNFVENILYVKYLNYIKEHTEDSTILGYIDQINKLREEGNTECAENYICSAYAAYAQSKERYGCEQLQDFCTFLSQQKEYPKLDIQAHRIASKENYQIIENHISKAHCLAIILVKIGELLYHWVVVGRDVNDSFMRNAADLGSFESQHNYTKLISLNELTITECVLLAPAKD